MFNKFHAALTLRRHINQLDNSSVFPVQSLKFFPVRKAHKLLFLRAFPARRDIGPLQIHAPDGRPGGRMLHAVLRSGKGRPNPRGRNRHGRRTERSDAFRNQMARHPRYSFPCSVAEIGPRAAVKMKVHKARNDQATGQIHAVSRQVWRNPGNPLPRNGKVGPHQVKIVVQQFCILKKHGTSSFHRVSLPGKPQRVAVRHDCGIGMQL